MATLTPITPPCGDGSFPPHPSPSPIMLGFGRFLTAAETLIAAEFDLSGHCGHDPAVDAWFRTAERARDGVLELIAQNLDLAPVAPGDTHLLRVLRLFRKVMLSTDPDQVERLRLRVVGMPERYLALGVTGIDGAVNRMVLQGLDRFEDYLAIEEIRADAGETNPAHADVEACPAF